MNSAAEEDPKYSPYQRYPGYSKRFFFCFFFFVFFWLFRIACIALLLILSASLDAYFVKNSIYDSGNQRVCTGIT